MLKRIGRGTAAILGLLVVLAVLSALSNLGLPKHSRVVKTLNEVEKARIAEAYHLRSELGDEVWPGWGEAEIPLIVYNEEFAFLIGFPGEPPAGWTMVPSGEQRGGSWEKVPEDAFFGQEYFRQRLTSPDETPENFTVRVGETWAATLMTREYARIRMAADMQEELPPVLSSMIPYRLLWKLLLGASETYIGGIAHESFHAYQGISALEQFREAESVHAQGEYYPWKEEAFVESWSKELDKLAEAVFASSPEESRKLAADFIKMREERRRSADLAPELINYERQREWIEGTAKYAELTLQRKAGADADYQPLEAVAVDPDFSRYQDRERYWKGQVQELKRTESREGDSRFYYTGFAQGVLLDKFLPGWKTRLWTEEIWIEELLAEAVADY